MLAVQREFSKFYRDHVRLLHGYFRRLGVCQPELIEDLLQETFAEALRCWSNLKEPAAGRAWLLTIGRRQLGRVIRKNKQLRLDLVEHSVIEQHPTSTCPVDSGLNSLRFCQQILALICLEADSDKRAVLAAYFLEEQSFREISANTGLNLSTLTTWTSRFRQKCLKLYGASWESTQDEPRIDDTKGLTWS